ncbi:IS630 family transposase [Nocardiopsis sp. CNT-189]
MEGFLVLLGPLIDRGRERLRAGVEEIGARLPLRIAGDAIERDLLQALHRDLTVLLSRTMVLELNVARLEGRLTAPSPEERFQEFIGSLRDPGLARTILAEYPVLAPQAATRVDQWVRAALGLLADLAADWTDIRTALDVPESATTLVGVASGMGDRHADGRSVSALLFDSGTRIVYKPRPMSVDVHFQELLEWVNAHGRGPRFRVLSVLDRGDHGWAEFVEAQACASAEEVSEFYRRQGGYLVLLHVLHAVDFHFENLIAAGPHPVLVDLETLFHPNHWRGTGSVAPANTVLGESVLQTGLLPRRRYLNGDDQDTGTETSGLGGPGGQETPFLMPRWEDYGSDEMRLERGRQVIPGGDNRPVLDGTAAEPLAYLEEVVAGFTDTYRTLTRHRAFLLAPGGSIERFADDRVRFIARPTTTYARTLAESYHPDVLRDALDRDRLLDWIWIGRDHNPVKAALFAADEDTVRDVIHRFNRIGLDCLDPNRAGGRPRLLNTEQEEHVATTATTRPTALGKPFTHWSIRKLTDHLRQDPRQPLRISRETLRRILHRRGATFQRTRTWKDPPDPEADTKLERIEHVTTHFPDRTFAFDEFGPLGIRPAHGAGWAPRNRPDRIPATYRRTHGITYFHGCYPVGSDTLWGINHRRKGGANTLKALKSIRSARPDGAPVYVIMDNLSAHKGPAIRAWARRNKVESCFTPTYASWANPIEAHFGPLRRFTIANSHHPDHTVQTRALHAYLRWRNANARDPDVLTAQRRERARARSEKGLRWGGRPPATAA